MATIDSNHMATRPQWSRIDDRGLARFVSSQANRWLPLQINRFDLSSNPEASKVVAKAIYEQLVSCRIRYALEAYHPSEALQTIRTPHEVLTSPREGTCLDLATLFCGLCLAYELLPLIIVTETHALVAISTKHGVRDWNGYRSERDLFNDGPLRTIDPLVDLINSGSFLPIECTGFAQSDRLHKYSDGQQERANGFLTFDQAVSAATAEIKNAKESFRFALDVAVAHYAWRIDPYPLDVQPGALTLNIFRLLSETSIALSSNLRSLDFERLVEERTAHFVGRDFVFREIDRLIADPAFKSGYILVRGEPGIGKTSLIAQLVKNRGYLHHFNIAPQNIRSARAFLESTCSQIIKRYQLNYSTLPPDSTKDSAFLGQLLGEAAKKVGGGPIVILVDALDEAEDAELASASNRLYLPPSLPPNVYFIVTSREQMDYRLVVDSQSDVYIKDNDPQNLHDVKEYVLQFVGSHHDAIQSKLQTWNVTEADFTDLIVERSQGNFMYLVHVLNDILAGRLSPETIDNIQDLPRGLRAYYERHWRTMRNHDRDRFERIYEPVLRLLATVREPVALEDIRNWSKLDPARVHDVVRDWRPFLNLETKNGIELYRVYHASFQDFLAQEGVGLGPSHRLIVTTALAKIPGFFDPDNIPAPDSKDTPAPDPEDTPSP